MRKDTDNSHGLLLVCTLLIIVLIPGSVRAEWIDDWMRQRTYTGPNYFHATNRGYGTFGSASMRWNNSSDYVMGVSMPSYKKGCGGIDLFLGGFQFMDFDYLVDKLEAMMGPAIATFAFELALGVLSQQSLDVVNSLMAIVDRLNQLQFDDCESQKTMTAVLHAAASLDRDTFAKDASQAVTDYAVSSGLSDLYNEVKNFGQGRTPGNALSDAGGSISETFSGCPSDLQSIYFTAGYILDHLMDLKGSPYTADYAALMRGLIGDVEVQLVGNNIAYASVTPCAHNPDIGDITVAHFLDGEIEKKTGGDCRALDRLNINGGSYETIREYVRETLAEIARKTVDRQTLDETEESFLAGIPAAVHKALTAYIGIQGGAADTDEIALMFTEYVAAGQVYQMVNDFHAHMARALDLARTAYDDQGGATAENDQNRCHYELARSARRSVEGLKKDLAKLSARIAHDYHISRSVLLSNLQVNEYFLRQADSLLDVTAKRMEGNTQQVDPKSGF